MDITENITASIKHLKDCRSNDDKQKQYNKIASEFRQYFKQTNTLRFRLDLILSFFECGFFPLRTQQRHTKNIIDRLKENSIITDDKINKIAKQRRIYELKSKDFGSYTALMNDNGFKEVVYYVWKCNSDGIPYKKKVGKSGINGLPVDKNGLPVEDYDISVLKQTIPRDKQGVYSYGYKSIAYKQREYSVKCYRVIC